MRIAVFGAGGVGGYFGGRLAQAGEDVTFIARGRHLEAMRARGLRVDSIDGDFHLPEVAATDDPAEVGPVEAVLVAVKSWQVPEAARAMGPLIGDETIVVPLENGVEAPEQLAEAVPRERVLGGLCAIISFISTPGHITHAGYEPSVAFGELDNRRSRRAEELHAAFARAGVKVEIPDDINVAMWRKFLFISGFSGIGAVTQVPAGVFRSVAPTRELLVDCFEETAAVGRAAGVGLPEETVETALAMIDKMPDDATASMQRDIMEGRPSELDAQTGAIVRFGRQQSVPTPVNDFIYRVLLPREIEARAAAGLPEPRGARL